MEISIKRVLCHTMFGFTLVMAIACASSGCADQEPDLGTWTESGDEVLPPADPEEPWCGLDETVTPTDVPAFGEDWTNGHPFEVDDAVGYLDVTRWSNWTALTVRVFDENNIEHSYSLSARQTGTGYDYCDYFVHDVLVDGPRVHVLHAATCWSEAGQVLQRWVEISTIDVEFGLSATYGYWQLAQEPYRLYQLAIDGDDMLIGSYMTYGAEFAFRRVYRQNGLTWLGEPTPVGTPSAEWSFQRFISFDAQDGLLTYRLADPRAVRTTRFRACP